MRKGFPREIEIELSVDLLGAPRCPTCGKNAGEDDCAQPWIVTLSVKGLSFRPKFSKSEEFHIDWHATREAAIRNGFRGSRKCG